MQTEIEYAASLSFLDRYNAVIAPKLKEIDIVMRTGAKNFSTKTVSRLLYISEKEVEEIIRQQHLQKIDCHAFFRIMRQGSSEICQLFSRELKSGSPKCYTPSDVSYIYDIDIDVVLNTCHKIGLLEFNPITLKILLSNIMLEDALKKS